MVETLTDTRKWWFPPLADRLPGLWGGIYDGIRLADIAIAWVRWRIQALSVRMAWHPIVMLSCHEVHSSRALALQCIQSSLM